MSSEYTFKILITPRNALLSNEQLLQYLVFRLEIIVSLLLNVI